MQNLIIYIAKKKNFFLVVSIVLKKIVNIQFEFFFYYEELSELSPITELSIGEVIKHIKIWMSAKHQADQQQILRIYAVFHVRKTIFIAYMNAKGTLIAIYRTFSLVREFQRNLSSHECSGIIGVRSGIVHSIWGVGETIVFPQKQSLMYFLLHFQSRNHNNMQMDLTLNSVIQLKQSHIIIPAVILRLGT